MLMKLLKIFKKSDEIKKEKEATKSKILKIFKKKYLKKN